MKGLRSPYSSRKFVQVLAFPCLVHLENSPTVREGYRKLQEEGKHAGLRDRHAGLVPS